MLLSDGGHFENLASTRWSCAACRYIVVSDGSADPEGSYDDLGGAVRKIRIDFGIRIEFKHSFRILPRPDSLKQRGAYCAVGDIHYEDVDDPCSLQGDGYNPGVNPLTGKLIYIKPAVYGDEPRDVFNYAKSHGTFPHESTADQFFDEPQFESHRVLGFYILEKLFKEAERDTTHSPPAAVYDLEHFTARLEELAEQGQGAAQGQRGGGRDNGDDQ